MPNSKLEKLQSEIDFFMGRNRATQKQLQRLAGILGHCSTLVRGGRTFSHRVISLLKCFTGKRRYVRLGQEFERDLDWWQSFASWFNGISAIIKSAEASHSFATDSSFSGFGVTYNRDWISGTWQGSMFRPQEKKSARCCRFESLSDSGFIAPNLAFYRPHKAQLDI